MSLADRLGQDLTEAMGDCYRAAGVVFNINSTAEPRSLVIPKDGVGRVLNTTILTGKGEQKKRDGERTRVVQISLQMPTLWLSTP